MVSLFKYPMPRKKGLFFLSVLEKKIKKKVHDAHGLLKEGAGNTPEEHSTLPTFPCNDIDLSFGCSISPALWAEGTVQDSNHCQGREEEILQGMMVSTSEAHSEQTAYLEHRHGHRGGGYLQVGGGSKREEKAKWKQKKQQQKNHVIATEVIC